MTEFTRNRLSPTTVIACLALFFAVAGGSAIALKGKNSVDSGDLKKNSVKSADIAKNNVKYADIAANAVNGAKIKNSSVGSGDLAAGSVGSAALQDGGVAAVDLAPDETVRRVGDPGQPAFGNGGQGDCLWSKLIPGPGFGDPYVDPFFYKDAHGRVHIEGSFQSVDGTGGDATCDSDPNDEDQLLFVLPAGYQPAGLTTFPVYEADTPGYTPVSIIGAQGLTFGPISYAPGSVVVSEPNLSTAVLFGDVSFRAPGGSSGLPRRAAGGSASVSPGAPLPPLGD